MALFGKIFGRKGKKHLLEPPPTTKRRLQPPFDNPSADDIIIPIIHRHKKMTGVKPPIEEVLAKYKQKTGVDWQSIIEPDIVNYLRTSQSYVVFPSQSHGSLGKVALKIGVEMERFPIQGGGVTEPPRSQPQSQSRTSSELRAPPTEKIYPREPQPAPEMGSRDRDLNLDPVVQQVGYSKAAAPPIPIPMGQPDSFAWDSSPSAPTATPSVFGVIRVAPSAPTASPSMLMSPSATAGGWEPTQDMPSGVDIFEPLSQFLAKNGLRAYLEEFVSREILLQDLGDLLEMEETLREMFPKQFPRRRFVRAVRAQLFLGGFSQPAAQEGPEKWLLDPSTIQVGTVIGHGSFGVVFSAAMRIGAQTLRVAVKEVSLLRVSKEAVLQEVGVMVECQHKNVLKCWGCYFSADKAHVVTEYCEKGSLDANIRPGGTLFRSFDERVAVLRQVAEGLQYLHGKGIVHRDLKPQNLLVGSDDVIRLCDFGTSKHAASVAGTLAGTVGYMPPSFDGDPKKIDVYAFGVLCYEVMSEKQAYHDLRVELGHDQVRMLQYIHESGARPNLADCGSEFSEDSPLGMLIAQCWEEMPQSRPTMEEIVQVLVSVSSTSSLLMSASLSSSGKSSSLRVCRSSSGSWQPYIVKLGECESILAAAIHGQNGDRWATSVDFKVSRAEVKTIVSALSSFSKRCSVQTHGFYLAGKKFVTREVSENFIQGVSGEDHAVCHRTKKAVVIALSGGVGLESVRVHVAKIADYLRSRTY